VQVLPESEWRGQTETIVEEGDVTRDEGAEEVDVGVEGDVEARERQVLKDAGGRGVQVTAKVVGIIKRNWRTYAPRNLLPPLLPTFPHPFRSCKPSKSCCVCRILTF
jgi:hypothetical protein